MLGTQAKYQPDRQFRDLARTPKRLMFCPSVKLRIFPDNKSSVLKSNQEVFNVRSQSGFGRQ